MEWEIHAQATPVLEPSRGGSREVMIKERPLLESKGLAVGVNLIHFRVSEGQGVTREGGVMSLERHAPSSSKKSLSCLDVCATRA